jgi:hypothetical protein
MGITNRNITIKFEGHEIAVSARVGSVSSKGGTTTIHLYIDGEVAESADVPFLAALPSIELILRGRLPSPLADGKPRVVKARLRAGLLQRPSYEIFVDDALLHSEKGMWGGF